MSNPKRTQADINRINIYTDPPGRDGWLVDVFYSDGKAAEFRIDHYNRTGLNEDMLQLTVDAIKLQLEGGALQ